MKNNKKIGFPNDKASGIVSKTLREFLEKNHENVI